MLSLWIILFLYYLPCFWVKQVLLVCFKWAYSSSAYYLHLQDTVFPNSSYYCVYPKCEESKERHVLFGDLETSVPATCEDKSFLIVPLISTGMDSITHNRIMAWGSIEQWKCFLYIVFVYSWLVYIIVWLLFINDYCAVSNHEVLNCIL